MNLFKKNNFISSWVTEGAGKKILFLPGWAESHSVWQKSCPKDIIGYEKIFMNLGGHFPSEFPSHKNHLTLDEFLESHFQVFHEIAGNDRLTLIGHSTGAFVNWQYMNRYPNKVDKNILVGSFLEGPIGGMISVLELLKNWNLSFLTDFIFGFYQNSQSIFYDSALSVNPANKQEFLNREDVKEFFPTFFEQYKKMNPKSLRIIIEILENIRLANLHLREGLPLYFIHGDKDPVVPHTQVKNFCEKYKTAKLFTVPDTGHSPHWENPTTFWKIVRDILEN
jgi:pimeloyl-ACP methyl ester carboxylesterase